MVIRRKRKMKTKVLLHIPHTSLKLPKSFYKGLLISKCRHGKNMILNIHMIQYVNGIYFVEIKQKNIGYPNKLN
jgi:hypothetical protein